eukprot:11425558-Alexandrium_andersonii.AAC.1
MAHAAPESIEVATAADVFAKHALEHFQTVAADADHFYSLARSVPVDTLEHRLTTVAPRPQQRD